MEKSKYNEKKEEFQRNLKKEPINKYLKIMKEKWIIHPYKKCKILIKIKMILCSNMISNILTYKFKKNYKINQDKDIDNNQI